MHNKVTGLIQYLLLEKDIYLEIYQLSLRKTDVITKGDTAALTEITADEKELLSRLDETAARRLQAASEISKELNLDSGTITITKIANSIKNNYLKKKLNSIVNDFDLIFQRQKKVNETNQTLLQKNLNYINSLINAIAAGNDNITYNTSGNKTEQHINLFDKRA